MLMTMQSTSSPKSVASDGLTYYREGTNGAAVMLVHGVTGSPIEMKYVAKALNRAGYTVYAPLLAGHGRDLAALRRTRWEDWYDGIASAAYLLSRRVDRMFVAGMCMGGLLGLRLANEDRNVCGLAIYSPLLRYDGWNTPWHYRLDRVGLPIVVALGLGRWFSLKERSPFGIKSVRIRRLLADGIRGTLPAFPLETVYENQKLIAYTLEILPKVITPTLLIHAREDDVAGPLNPVRVKDRIGGECTIAWLRDSYHMIHIDQEHHLVSTFSREFFDGLR